MKRTIEREEEINMNMKFYDELLDEKARQKYHDERRDAEMNIMRRDD